MRKFKTFWMMDRMLHVQLQIMRIIIGSWMVVHKQMLLKHKNSIAMVPDHYQKETCGLSFCS